MLRAVALLFCALSLSACIRPKPRFHGSEVDFRSRLKVLCVAPATLMFPHKNAKELSKTLTSEIVTVLQGGGFQVPDPTKVDDIQIGVVSMMGGAYNPHTGRIDRDKHRAIEQQSYFRLRAELGCDAVLEPAVVVVTTSFRSGAAYWDGVSEQMPQSYGLQGWVSALSLWVRIYDLEGKEQYFGTGGIQVLTRIRSGFFDTATESVGEDAILAAPERRRGAIHEALAPFAPLPSPS